MANTKSSKKDLRRIAKRTVTNKAVRSSLKTYIKKARTSMATGDPNTTGAAVIDVVSALDKAAQNGIIHKKQAARRKSRIAKAANAAVKAGGTAVAAPVKEGKKAVVSKKAAPKAAAAKPAAEKKAPVAKKPAAATKKPATKKPAAKKTKAE